jgi:hypothetical protein
MFWKNTSLERELSDNSVVASREFCDMSSLGYVLGVGRDDDSISTTLYPRLMRGVWKADVHQSRHDKRIPREKTHYQFQNPDFVPYTE